MDWLKSAVPHNNYCIKFNDKLTSVVIFIYSRSDHEGRKSYKALQAVSTSSLLVSGPGQAKKHRHIYKYSDEVFEIQIF